MLDISTRNLRFNCAATSLEGWTLRPSTIFRGNDAIALDALPVRGVGWVLKWAGTIAVLVLAATILAGFAFQLAAERTLANAARRDCVRPPCPARRASSVEAVVRQQLAGLQRNSIERPRCV